MPACDEILGLVLVALDGKSADPGVRQPVEPGAVDAHLRGGAVGLLAHHGAAIAGRGASAEEGGRGRWDGGEALEPGLIDGVAVPMGEEADAVGAPHQGIEIVGHGLERQAVKDVLAHVEARHEIERHRR